MFEVDASPWHMPRLGASLGIDLLVQRDDLLPFPLSSSKVRAVDAELRFAAKDANVLITNGSVDSNHCRTVAFTAADRGLRCSLVLHGDSTSPASRRSLRLYRDLGAETVVVEASQIPKHLDAFEQKAVRAGLRPHVIAGGCHTPAAARAYRAAAEHVLGELQPDAVFVASGTGAIQGGLAAAAASLPIQPRIVGISIARPADRGVTPVRQAAAWAGVEDVDIEFLDHFRDGGYGQWGPSTASAVALGWRHGLPLDFTYTGKAFAALVEMAAREFSGLRVLFWHTGGLWNYIQQLPD